MNIFKRKSVKSDITLEERSMENKRALMGLLDVLSENSGKNMERWQEAIRHGEPKGVSGG